MRACGPAAHCASVTFLPRLSPLANRPPSRSAPASGSRQHRCKARSGQPRCGERLVQQPNSAARLIRAIAIPPVLSSNLTSPSAASPSSLAPGRSLPFLPRAPGFHVAHQPRKPLCKVPSAAIQPHRGHHNCCRRIVAPSSMREAKISAHEWPSTTRRPRNVPVPLLLLSRPGENRSLAEWDRESRRSRPARANRIVISTGNLSSGNASRYFSNTSPARPN